MQPRHGRTVQVLQAVGEAGKLPAYHVLPCTIHAEKSEVAKPAWKKSPLARVQLSDTAKNAATMSHKDTRITMYNCRQIQLKPYLAEVAAEATHRLTEYTKAARCVCCH